MDELGHIQRLGHGSYDCGWQKGWIHINDETCTTKPRYYVSWTTHKHRNDGYVGEAITSYYYLNGQVSIYRCRIPTIVTMVLDEEIEGYRDILLDKLSTLKG